jgi:hypothetical protein
VLALGIDRAGEMRITRFLHNERVRPGEMVATAAAGTAKRVAGRHVLAIQDTTTVRERPGEARSMVLHPTIAVDAENGALLGLVHAEMFERGGGARELRKHRSLEDKQSLRWLTGSEAASLLAAQAAQVTVIADREADIYEEFALRPAGVDLLIRSAQDRALQGGERLYSCTAALPAAGGLVVDVPAAPGRPARQAKVLLRWRKVVVQQPQNRTAAHRLPAQVTLNLLEARETQAPGNAQPLHWHLLTTHPIAELSQALRILDLYRQRWTIEQLFRVLKTKGFDVETSRIADGVPFENFITAALIAAITVQQLVRDRDGAAKRPLCDALDPDDQPALEALNASLEGKTLKQKNPHSRGSLAFAAWVFARLGGWSGYYGKPGPITILKGLLRFQDIKQGFDLLLTASKDV